jgi:divalent metal cation (Fe/Co/Zn/Cd) transporter
VCHLGVANYLSFTQLDVVLAPEMQLQEAHDIGESLQRELEAQEFVERAFVHLDTEYNHRADDEHLPVW